MTTFVRGTCASLGLGLALVLAGCGGGGSGVTTPTGTPTPTPNSAGPIVAGQMVFVSTHTGATELFRANADGTSAVQLTHLADRGITNIEKPSVSPDGRRIVFQFGLPATGTGTANTEIGLINTNGTGFLQLTSDTTVAGRPDDYQPVFSPDGQYIFWTSKRGTATSDKVPHIWRMNGAPGNAGGNQILFISTPSAYPSLNSTGNTLAYAPLDQTSAVALQTLANSSIPSGSTARLIGSNIAGNTVFNVALSPDGSRVAFSTVVTGATAPAGNTSSPAVAGLNILNTSTGASAGSATLSTTSNGGEAWSRDSGTLFFDGAGAGTTNRQIYSLSSPFTGTPHQVTADAQGANFSPAFLPGS